MNGMWVKMEVDDAENTSSSWMIRLAVVLIIAASFWFVFQDLAHNHIAFSDVISESSVQLWFGGGLIILLMVVWPLVWMVMMRGCGAEIPLRETYAIWWTTNIAKYVPGKVSLIAGRAWVARKWGSKVVLECFAWEVVISTSSALIAACLLLSSSEIDIFWKVLLGIATVFSLVPLLSLETTQRILRKPIAMLGKGEWNEPIAMTRGHYLRALLLMIGSWGIWGIAHQLILIGIGIEVPLEVLIGVFALAWLAGFFAFFLPAGIGVREGSLTYMITMLASGGAGAILAIISRTFNIIGEIFAFFIGGLLLKGTTLETTSIEDE